MLQDGGSNSDSIVPPCHRGLKATYFTFLMSISCFDESLVLDWSQEVDFKLIHKTLNLFTRSQSPKYLNKPFIP